jgi:hypothetical protein
LSQSQKQPVGKDDSSPEVPLAAAVPIIDDDQPEEMPAEGYFRAKDALFENEVNEADQANQQGAETLDASDEFDC